MKKRKKWSCDFETCTWLEDETYVWAWAMCEIGNEENCYTGIDIKDFLWFCEYNENSIGYFHNLKFDGNFIIDYLLNEGYTWIQNSSAKKTKSFTTLITSLGQFYSIEIYFKVTSKKTIKVTFYDSMKILPFSVKKIAKDFNLPIQKLSIDYNEYRERGHFLTDEEIEYIKHDVKIVSYALDTMFKEGMTKMTTAANALSEFKKIFGKRRFLEWFPELDIEVDDDLRAAYKGRIHIS